MVLQTENICQDEDRLILKDLSAFQMIGQGNTAEIFLYEPGTVLKLFRDGFPESGVMKEWRVTCSVQSVYERMPKTLRLVQYGDRWGILYELAEGQDLFHRIGADPFLLLTVGKKLAQLHAEIHEKEISGILTVREKLRQEIGWAEALTESEKKQITALLERLPDRNRLCHFDFHPGNIMTDGEQVRVLDWLTACSGDPAADIARTCILFKYGEVRNGDRMTRLILKATKACARRSYVRNICRFSGIKRREIEQWTVPVAAARLSEWLTEHEREQLLKLIRKYLKQ